MLFRSKASRPHALSVGRPASDADRGRLQRLALAANGFAQVTAPAARFRTFPAWLAIGSLDKVFVRGAIDVRHARVVRTSLSKRASDHLPLVVDFHLT